jgi:hypothetical protein
MPRPIYEPRYASSRALVMGINEYQHASPLSFPVADAEAIAEVLRTRFGFPDANVTVLLNDAVNKASVLGAFYGLASQSGDPSDRVVVFFAGHGYTVHGRHGDVGFLVPYDGNPDNLEEGFSPRRRRTCACATDTALGRLARNCQPPPAAVCASRPAPASG